MADRGHGQRVGELLDGVDAVLSGEAVDQPVGDLGEPGAELTRGSCSNATISAYVNAATAIEYGLMAALVP
ncbi:hypothetical protein ACIBI9_57990 [Nonomuraea sp. NPDC050451]|uniref:hypothetical protein n=1 Tax=Nonomuraea sp. NPDC050451 TaxID=3364364 RepID=UPI0037ADAD32